MNREERNEHIENLRRKLMMRKKALNRREADEDDYWSSPKLQLISKI